MKQYVIDELRLEDQEKIKAWLDAHLEPSPLGDLYWLPLDSEILSEEQKAHAACGPHVFALDLSPGRLSCELLVRTRKRVTCQCIGYATDRQFLWLVRRMDSLFEAAGVLS
ncbi:hypothetical protein [Desulfoluna sp.]|uniref:hypothetical protein n=1 Tax=Desulfoluna sp. TaxID=2045199 RepID=UPI002629094F|nr:hypothetical protein [Desulfoluna sp.]